MKVLIENERGGVTTGTLETMGADIGDDVIIKLRDENGMEIHAVGKLLDILEED